MGLEPDEDGIEYDLSEATTADRPRCAYCLQPVEAAAARTCVRCRTLYHPDCWSANDARCAVYGCDPVLPPPPRRRRIRFRTPAAAQRGGRGNQFPFVILFIAVVSAMFAFRFGATHHVGSWDAEIAEPRDRAGNWPTQEPELEPPAKFRPVDAKYAEALAGRAEQVLADLELRGDLPKDPESRSALRKEVEAAMMLFRKAVYICSKRGVHDRIGNWMEKIDRLQKIRGELSGPGP